MYAGGCNPTCSPRRLAATDAEASIKAAAGCVIHTFLAWL
jgi:hypothetical protein